MFNENDVFGTPLNDYSKVFQVQDEEYLYYHVEYSGLRSFFPDDFERREELVKDIYAIMEKADTDPSFTKEFGKLTELCIHVKKFFGEIPQTIAKNHKNPFDDSLVEPNICDTLGQHWTEPTDNRDRSYIKINTSKIKENHPEKDGILILTILHELMHAAMHVQGDEELKPDYWYYKEEAYANAFALKLIYLDQRYFNEAIEFVKEQPDGYNAGERLWDQDLDMEAFRQEKQEALHQNYQSLRAIKENQESWLKEYVFTV